MKTSDADILILPGYGGGTSDHWYRRWAEKLSSAKVIEQENWEKPSASAWVENVVAAVEAATKPVVLVSHSLGSATVPLVGKALVEKGLADKIRSAFIVAPPHHNSPEVAALPIGEFFPLTSDPLPFPSRLVASKNDPYCSFEDAQNLAADWGSFFQDAGEVGHINDESGHGPWPEGLLAFASFMKKL